MSILKTLPTVKPEDNETGCCPRFHPEDWDNRIFDFSAYDFIADESRSFLYRPLNLGPVMTRSQKAIQEAKQPDPEHILILSEDLSPWKCRHHFLTQGEVPHYTLEKIKGNYLAKVCDGSYADLPRWIKDYQEFLKAEYGGEKKILAYYTTCPKCAETYKHNYIVLFARVEA